MLVTQLEQGAKVDPALFRKVMGSFASGVTIITTEARGEIRGMTASAFMSGSLHPPLCIISVARSARMHAFLEEARQFGVSILAQGQERLSRHFAGRPARDLQPLFEHVGGALVLVGACASIAADIVARHDCGDHSIFVGRIVALQANGNAPLIVHGGWYASLMNSGKKIPDPIVDFW
jgi:flavin reductase